MEERRDGEGKRERETERGRERESGREERRRGEERERDGEGKRERERERGKKERGRGRGIRILVGRGLGKDGIFRKEERNVKPKNSTAVCGAYLVHEPPQYHSWVPSNVGMETSD